MTLSAYIGSKESERIAAMNCLTEAHVISDLAIGPEDVALADQEAAMGLLFWRHDDWRGK